MRSSCDDGAASSAALLSELSRLEAEASIGEVEVRLLRVYLQSVDSRSQVTAIQCVLSEVRESLHRYNKVLAALEEREFLKSIETVEMSRDNGASCCVERGPLSSQVLKENLVRIVDAVIDWRKTLSAPLPVVTSTGGSHVLFDLLKDVVSDIAEMQSGVAPLDYTSIATPRVPAAFVPHRSTTKKSAAEALLAFSGYFPYSLGGDDVAAACQHSSESKHVTHAYHHALQYLRGEHQRQISLCRKRFELAKGKKYLPLLECYARFSCTGAERMLPEYLVLQEERQSILALRAVTHMFSDADKAALHLVYDAHVAKGITNVRNFVVGLPGRPLPAYVLAIGRSPLRLEDQVRALLSFHHVSQRFLSWVRFSRLAKVRAVATALEVKSQKAVMKLRLVAWYRFVSRGRSSPVHSMRARRRSIAFSKSSDPDQDLSSPSPLLSTSATGASSFYVAPAASDTFCSSVTDARVSSGVQAGGSKKAVLFIHTKRRPAVESCS